MANIDNIILGVDASNPHNPLEKWVAKINGTYDGDIPEPTSDIEKTLKKYYEQQPAPGPGPSSNGWAKAKIYNEYYDQLAIKYVGPDGWHFVEIPKDSVNPTEITTVSLLYNNGEEVDSTTAQLEVIIVLSEAPGSNFASDITSASLHFDNPNQTVGDEGYSVITPSIMAEKYNNVNDVLVFIGDYDVMLNPDWQGPYDPETMYYEIRFHRKSQ